MALEGFDYAWGYTSGTSSALVKAGAKFVVRYVGTSSKCISSGELKALQAAGIGVGLVYETSGTTFTGGKAAGQADGAAAKAAAEKLGAPAGTPIWFAIDTDTSDFATVKNYLAGAVAASGSYRARLYASYKVIEAMGSGGHWQTYAWSGGKVSQGADLYQYQNGVTVGGVSMDRCRTLVGSGTSLKSGWFSDGTTVSTPAPSPAPAPAHPKDYYVHLGNVSPLSIRGVAFEQAQVSSGAASWKDLCASLVRNAYGIPIAIWGNNPRTAVGALHMVAKADLHDWYDAPEGVPVYWTGGSSGAGHVAIADGKGNVWSNDFGPAAYIGDGKDRLVPIASITEHDAALKYAGWGMTYLGVRVYEQPVAVAAPPVVVPAVVETPVPVDLTAWLKTANATQVQALITALQGALVSK